MYEVQGTLTCPPTPPHPTIAIFKNVRFTGTVFGPQAKRWTLRKSSGWRMKYMLFVKNYFLKPDKSARDKDASGMNRRKSSCTKIYCLVQTLPTKCACHGLCHHPVSMVLLASMTHQQVSHQHLDLTGGLKRSRAHIFRHGLEQTISMVQNKRHLKSPTRDGKIHTSIRQVQHQRSQ